MAKLHVAALGDLVIKVEDSDLVPHGPGEGIFRLALTDKPMRVEIEDQDVKRLRSGPGSDRTLGIGIARASGDRGDLELVDGWIVASVTRGNLRKLAYKGGPLGHLLEGQRPAREAVVICAEGLLVAVPCSRALPPGLRPAGNKDLTILVLMRPFGDGWRWRIYTSELPDLVSGRLSSPPEGLDVEAPFKALGIDTSVDVGSHQPLGRKDEWASLSELRWAIRVDGSASVPIFAQPEDDSSTIQHVNLAVHSLEAKKPLDGDWELSFCEATRPAAGSSELIAAWPALDLRKRPTVSLDGKPADGSDVLLEPIPSDLYDAELEGPALPEDEAVYQPSEPPVLWIRERHGWIQLETPDPREDGVLPRWAGTAFSEGSVLDLGPWLESTGLSVALMADNSGRKVITVAWEAEAAHVELSVTKPSFVLRLPQSVFWGASAEQRNPALPPADPDGSRARPLVLVSVGLVARDHRTGPPACLSLQIEAGRPSLRLSATPKVRLRHWRAEPGLPLDTPPGWSENDVEGWAPSDDAERANAGNRMQAPSALRPLLPIGLDAPGVCLRPDGIGLSLESESGDPAALRLPPPVGAERPLWDLREDNLGIELTPRDGDLMASRRHAVASLDQLYQSVDAELTASLKGNAAGGVVPLESTWVADRFHVPKIRDVHSLADVKDETKLGAAPQAVGEELETASWSSVRRQTVTLDGIPLFDLLVERYDEDGGIRRWGLVRLASDAERGAPPTLCGLPLRALELNVKEGPTPRLELRLAVGGASDAGKRPALGILEFDIEPTQDGSFEIKSMPEGTSRILIPQEQITNLKVDDPNTHECLLRYVELVGVQVDGSNLTGRVTYWFGQEPGLFKLDGGEDEICVALGEAAPGIFIRKVGTGDVGGTLSAEDVVSALFVQHEFPGITLRESLFPVEVEPGNESSRGYSLHLQARDPEHEGQRIAGVELEEATISALGHRVLVSWAGRGPYADGLVPSVIEHDGIVPAALTRCFLELRRFETGRLQVISGMIGWEIARAFGMVAEGAPQQGRAPQATLVIRPPGDRLLPREENDPPAMPPIFTWAFRPRSDWPKAGDEPIRDPAAGSDEWFLELNGMLTARHESPADPRSQRVHEVRAFFWDVAIRLDPSKSSVCPAIEPGSLERGLPVPVFVRHEFAEAGEPETMRFVAFQTGHISEGRIDLSTVLYVAKPDRQSRMPRTTRSIAQRRGLFALEVNRQLIGRELSGSPAILQIRCVPEDGGSHGWKLGASRALGRPAVLRWDLALQQLNRIDNPAALLRPEEGTANTAWVTAVPALAEIDGPAGGSVVLLDLADSDEITGDLLAATLYETESAGRGDRPLAWVPCPLVASDSRFGDPAGNRARLWVVTADGLRTLHRFPPGMVSPGAAEGVLLRSGWHREAILEEHADKGQVQWKLVDSPLLNQSLSLHWFAGRTPSPDQAACYDTARGVRGSDAPDLGGDANAVRITEVKPLVDAKPALVPSVDLLLELSQDVDPDAFELTRAGLRLGRHTPFERDEPRPFVPSAAHSAFWARGPVGACLRPSFKGAWSTGGEASKDGSASAFVPRKLRLCLAAERPGEKTRLTVATRAEVAPIGGTPSHVALGGGHELTLRLARAKGGAEEIEGSFSAPDVGDGLPLTRIELRWQRLRAQDWYSLGSEKGESAVVFLRGSPACHVVTPDEPLPFWLFFDLKALKQSFGPKPSEAEVRIQIIAKDSDWDPARLTQGPAPENGFALAVDEQNKKILNGIAMISLEGRDPITLRGAVPLAPGAPAFGELQFSFKIDAVVNGTPADAAKAHYEFGLAGDPLTVLVDASAPAAPRGGLLGVIRCVAYDDGERLVLYGPERQGAWEPLVLEKEEQRLVVWGREGGDVDFVPRSVAETAPVSYRVFTINHLGSYSAGALTAAGADRNGGV